MGAERDDAAAAKPRRMPTEPGLGGIPAGSGHSAAAAPADPDDQPEAVDFDALHAALGDPLDLDELPHHDAYDPHAPDDDGFDEEPDDGGEQEELEGRESSDEDDGEQDYEGGGGGGEGGEPHVGESQGRSSAHYASARPHTIPPSNASTEDINAPPVIVANEDVGATVPSGPPQMTKPIHQTRPIAMTPMSGVPFVTQPLAAHQSGPHAVAVPYVESAPFTEPPAYPRGAPQMTVRMPDRPFGALNPRRGKIQTLVVRPRGPSTKQKLFAFMAMLLLVTACGIAVIIWRKPAWVGLEPSAPAAQPTTTATAPLAPAAPEGATATATATAPVASVMPSAGVAASASKAKPKPSASTTTPSPH